MSRRTAENDWRSTEKTYYRWTRRGGDFNHNMDRCRLLHDYIVAMHANRGCEQTTFTIAYFGVIRYTSMNSYSGRFEKLTPIPLPYSYCRSRLMMLQVSMAREAVTGIIWYYHQLHNIFLPVPFRYYWRAVLSCIVGRYISDSHAHMSAAKPCIIHNDIIWFGKSLTRIAVVWGASSVYIYIHKSKRGGGVPENRFAAYCCSYVRPHSLLGTKDDRYIHPARNTVHIYILSTSIIIIIINGQAAGAGAADRKSVV